MPRGDRTGPEGFGPMSGRGLGYCNGYESPGYTKGIPRGGRGYGRGRGFGRGPGYGRGNYGWYDRGYSNPEPAIPTASEKTLIENEIKVVKEHLKNLKKRLTEIKSDSE